MSNEKTTLIDFPCDFPLKIIGSHTHNFIEEITSIVLKHYPLTPEENISTKTSEKGNYISMTVIVFTENQMTLDALYYELTSHPHIKMVL